jgi:outer membrane protein OmpA-like peptidoglycan-associated protein
VLSGLFFWALTWPRQLERRREAAMRQTNDVATVDASDAQLADAQKTSVAEAVAVAAAVAPTGEPGQGTTGETGERMDPLRREEAMAMAAAVAPRAADGAVAIVRFTSPLHFMEVLNGYLAKGDGAAAAALVGPEVLAGERGVFFRTLFEQARLRPVSVAPLREIGDVGAWYRWSIRLQAVRPQTVPVAEEDVRPETSAVGAAGAAETPDITGEAITGASTATEREPEPESGRVRPVLEMEVDVKRDSERGWGAAAVHFPEPLREAVAAVLGAGSVPAALDHPVGGQDDPLTITGSFLRAVWQQDYAMARRVTDAERVTREKVAGLCILFEEGEYAIADQRPFSATVAGADSAWVIVKVRSARSGQESEFGLELAKRPEGDWRVAGVNFSKMLAGYTVAAGVAEGVAYAPIVKTPSGGESLVVYFDFNEVDLGARAQRQLEIVANLLRDDPQRKLRLSGHTDAVGSDAYNRQLSAARAFAVKNALAALGVSGEQVVTEGLGTLRPLDPNTKPDGSDNPEGRSRNRRTEIFLDF